MSDGARLMPYRPEYDAATVRWLDSEELRSTFGFRGPITVESHRRWLGSAVDVRIWAVQDTQGRHCGNTLLHVNERHRSGYFQLYIGEPNSRGQGIGAAALRLTLLQAFGDLALHRVWLHTLPGNAAAEALYRRHGFVHEGLEREALLAGSCFISQHRWSLLADEWSAL